MRLVRIFILLVLTGHFAKSQRQEWYKYFHENNFGQFTGVMGSYHYKLDTWEYQYYYKAIHTAFPSDLKKTPGQYKGKLIHLIGIIDTVFIDKQNDNFLMSLLLENKYWDYIEDYSIQDEVMFVSPLGDGKFKAILSVSNLDDNDIKTIKQFASGKKLLFVYGDFQDIENDIPIIAAREFKYVNYWFYTTNVFSYDISRDSVGQVITNAKGHPELTNFIRLKVAAPGQNK